MRARFAWLVAAALIPSAVVSLLAQQQTPPTTFRSGREVLAIDASVTGPGDVPITDLEGGGLHRQDRRRGAAGVDRAPLRCRRQPARATTPPSAVSPAPPTPRLGGSSSSWSIAPSLKAGSERAAIESASALLAKLSPSDAVAAIGLPGGGIDLTRDHAAVAEAIKKMTGVQPTPDWQHLLTWDEALGYEREDKIDHRARARARVPRRSNRTRASRQTQCPPALVQQAHEMLLQGRAQGNRHAHRTTRHLEEAGAAARAQAHGRAVGRPRLRRRSVVALPFAGAAGGREPRRALDRASRPGHRRGRPRPLQQRLRRP